MLEWLLSQEIVTTFVYFITNLDYLENLVSTTRNTTSIFLNNGWFYPLLFTLLVFCAIITLPQRKDIFGEGITARMEEVRENLYYLLTLPILAYLGYYAMKWTSLFYR